MGSFHERIKKDLLEVFENPAEFGETARVEYMGKKFSAVVVMDDCASALPDRNNQRIHDNRTDVSSYGIAQCDVTMYGKRDKFPEKPVQRARISVDGERYTILEVREEMGEYVLSLVRFGN